MVYFFKVSDVYVFYVKGDEVFKGVDFVLYIGELIFVCGVSGFGKIILFNVFFGFLFLLCGMVCINGVDIMKILEL